MALDKTNGGRSVVIICDDCQDPSQEFDNSRPLRDILGDIRAEGWRITFDQGSNEFKHHCPDCAQ